MIHFLAILAPTAAFVLAQGAADPLFAAFEKEQSHPASRTSIAWTMPDGSALRYTIERDTAGAARHVAERLGRRIEFFVDRDVLYAQENGSWKKRAAAAALPPAIEPDIVGLLRSNLQDAAELPPRVQQGTQLRVFEGALAWLRAKGRIEVLLDADSGQLAHVSFHGLCGGPQCGFEQTFERDPALRITLPDVP